MYLIQVDVLGDEVDTLLSIMGKIYIALDHYSPVLKHYPGVRKITRQVGALRCAVQVVLYMADTYEIQVANITVT